jgi:hypothetical protein
MLSLANFCARLPEHVRSLEKVAQRSTGRLQWFVKLPIGNVRALAMRRLDCRQDLQDLLPRKDLSICNMLQICKNPLE